jgi:hypothetical protein
LRRCGKHDRCSAGAVFILALLRNEPFIDVERRRGTILLRFGVDRVGMNEARFMIVDYPFVQGVL